MNRTTDKPVPAATPKPGETTAPREEGLLRRWSRRKARVRQEAQPPPAADAEEANAAMSPGAAHLPETSAPPVLTDADMPPVESLDRDSDYRPFMSSGVSNALRTRALRRLFHSGLFNERCRLDSEYYDCHGYEPLGSVITHEMREEMERAAAALKEQAREAVSGPAEPVAERSRPEPEPGMNAAAEPPAADPDPVTEG